MMVDVTNVINAVVMLIIAVLGTYFTHLQKQSNNTSQLNEWVKIAVSSAEQAYKVGMTQDRKQYALDVLARKGLKVNWNEIDDMIEAAVNQLPPVQKVVTSESMLDGRGD